MIKKYPVAFSHVTNESKQVRKSSRANVLRLRRGSQEELGCKKRIYDT